MRGPKPPLLELTAAERQDLEPLTRCHSAPHQLVLRAQIVLAAAASQNNGQIMRHLGVSRDMVRLWRQRWRQLAPVPLAELPIADRLTDVPRPGRPTRITADAVCQIVALACEAPATAGRPISQWTSREIADEVLSRGIVDQISPATPPGCSKRGSQTPPDPLLADPADR